MLPARDVSRPPGEDRWVAIAVRDDAEWRALCERPSGARSCGRGGGRPRGRSIAAVAAWTRRAPGGAGRGGAAGGGGARPRGPRYPGALRRSAAAAPRSLHRDRPRHLPHHHDRELAAAALAVRPRPRRRSGRCPWAATTAACWRRSWATPRTIASPSLEPSGVCSPNASTGAAVRHERSIRINGPIPTPTKASAVHCVSGASIAVQSRYGSSDRSEAIRREVRRHGHGGDHHRRRPGRR